jgi:ApeA N-terminal domain 1
MCDQLNQTITTVCPNPTLAGRLEDSIRFANEPSFKNRIEMLIGRIKKEHSEALLGDVTVFNQTLRQTRNFFTHLGTKKGSKVLTGFKELFLFNQKLHALLRFLMLLGIGFPEDLVFEHVLYQSRKWR